MSAIGPSALHSLGKITVTTAGTPVQVTGSKTLARSAIIFADPSNTGKIWIGLSTLVKGTRVGLLGLLVAPSSSNVPSWSLTPYVVDGRGQQATIDLSTIYLDSDVNGEGAVVAYVAAV